MRRFATLTNAVRLTQVHLDWFRREPVVIQEEFGFDALLLGFEGHVLQGTVVVLLILHFLEKYFLFTLLFQLLPDKLFW